LRLALSKGPNRVGVYLPSLRTETGVTLLKVVSASIENSGLWKNSRAPVILSAFQVREWREMFHGDVTNPYFLMYRLQTVIIAAVKSVVLPMIQI
jgi:hypothetical protein